MDQVEPLFHFLQALGIVFDRLQIIAQAARQVGESLFHRGGLFRQVLLGRIDLGQFRQRMDCPPEQIAGSRGFGAAFIQGRQGFLGQQGQGFGIGETIPLLFQVRIFRRAQPGSFDLAGLEGQHVGAAFGILLDGPQVVQFTPQSQQVLVGFAVGQKIGFDPGVPVEQAQVCPHV